MLPDRFVPHYPPYPTFFPTSWMERPEGLTAPDHRDILLLDQCLRHYWEDAWNPGITPKHAVREMAEQIRKHACDPGDIVPNPLTLDWLKRAYEGAPGRRPWAEFLTVMLTHAALHAAPTTPARAES